MEVTDQLVAIMLPSLIHRVGGETVKRLKQQALPLGCEFKRIRRSRNWQLTGEAMAIQAFLIQLRAEDDREVEYLIKKLDAGLRLHSDKLEPLEAKLQRLIAQNPSITLAELMAATHCSLIQARAARFAEDLD
ncbi:ribosome recycling factor family protein [Vibrio metoecus]